MGIFDNLKNKQVNAFPARSNDVVTALEVKIVSVRFTDRDDKAGIFINMVDGNERSFVDVVTIPADNPEPTLSYMSVHYNQLAKQLGNKPADNSFGSMIEWLKTLAGKKVLINTERSEFNPEYIEINFDTEEANA